MNSYFRKHVSLTLNFGLISAVEVCIYPITKATNKNIQIRKINRQIHGR